MPIQERYLKQINKIQATVYSTFEMYIGNEELVLRMCNMQITGKPRKATHAHEQIIKFEKQIQNCE